MTGLRQAFIKAVAVPALIAGVGLLTACDGDPDLSNAGAPAPRVAPVIASSTPRDTSTTETASVTDTYVTGSRQDNRPVFDYARDKNTHRETKTDDGDPIFVKGYGPIRLTLHAKGNGGTLDPHKNYTVRLFWFDQATQDAAPHHQGVRLFQERSETLDNHGGGFDWTASVDLPPQTFTVYVVITPTDAPARGDGDWSAAEIVSCHIVTRVPDPAKATTDYQTGAD